MTWCQVSEDHCWIALGPGREDAIEVTTDTAAKRGLAPSAEAWAGWLYNGGHAVLCSPQACQLSQMCPKPPLWHQWSLSLLLILTLRI